MKNKNLEEILGKEPLANLIKKSKGIPGKNWKEDYYAESRYNAITSYSAVLGKVYKVVILENFYMKENFSRDYAFKAFTRYPTEKWKFIGEIWGDNYEGLYTQIKKKFEKYKEEIKIKEEKQIAKQESECVKKFKNFLGSR